MATKAELEVKIVELETALAEVPGVPGVEYGQIYIASDDGLVVYEVTTDGKFKELEHKLFEAANVIAEQEKMIEAARAVEDSLNSMVADGVKAAGEQLHAKLVAGLGEHYAGYLDRAYAPADELGLDRAGADTGMMMQTVLDIALADLCGFKGEMPVAERLTAIVGAEKWAQAVSQALDETALPSAVVLTEITVGELDDMTLHVLLAPERKVAFKDGEHGQAHQLASSSVEAAMSDTERGQLLAKLSRLEIERNDARHKGQLVANELAQVRAANAGTMHGSIDNLSTG